MALYVRDSRTWQYIRSRLPACTRKQGIGRRSDGSSLRYRCSATDSGGRTCGRTGDIPHNDGPAGAAANTSRVAVPCSSLLLRIQYSILMSCSIFVNRIATQVTPGNNNTLDGNRLGIHWLIESPRTIL